MQTSNILGCSDQLLNLKERVRDFVEREAMPLEHAGLIHDVQALDDVARSLREKAKAAGIYASHLPVELGGLRLSWRDRAVILEETGRSFLGPIAINCAPPDQPNMINLIRHGSQKQRAKYPEPLIRGEIRSCFPIACGLLVGPPGR